MRLRLMDLCGLAWPGAVTLLCTVCIERLVLAEEVQNAKAAPAQSTPSRVADRSSCSQLLALWVPETLAGLFRKFWPVGLCLVRSLWFV